MTNHENIPTENLPLFSRSIMGGKKNSKLEARITDELKESVRRRWSDRGFSSESEYLEMLVMVDVFGREHVSMMHTQRLRMVCGLSDDARAGASQ